MLHKILCAVDKCIMAQLLLQSVSSLFLQRDLRTLLLLPARIHKLLLEFYTSQLFNSTLNVKGTTLRHISSAVHIFFFYIC